MNEFDEIVTVRHIHDLLRERGLERTPAEIRHTAAKLARRMRVTISLAYERWEAVLLSNNPNPESWE